jgi:hypothetical protein
VSLLFALGVLTQNVQLLPVGSEYQPWIYCVVLPYAFLSALAANSSVLKTRLLGTLCFSVSIVVMLVIAIAHTGAVPFKDALRMSGLPLVALSTWIYLRDVPGRVVSLLILGHVAILMLGLAAPNLATAITSAAGGRGQLYAVGWSSYFYSEPSYAALTFLFLAFFSSRDGKLAIVDGVALVLLSISTFSVTGVFGAAVVTATLVWQRSKLAFAGGCLAALVGVFSLGLVLADSPISSLGRVADLVSAVEGLRGMGWEAALLALNAAEPSGMWRILSNLYGISCAADLPWGLGSTDIAVALSFSKCSGSLASMLIENPTYSGLSSGLSAQSVFANLAVFAGVPGLMLGGLLLAIQIVALGRAEIRSSLPLAVMIVMLFVVWQSAWAAPTASLMIAAAYRNRERDEATRPRFSPATSGEARG